MLGVDGGIGGGGMGGGGGSADGVGSINGPLEVLRCLLH